MTTQVQVRNLKNEAVRGMDLSESVFAYASKPHLVYEAVCHFRARARKGTHSTKTRAEVAGGGRKPWKQKKTGRARAGSIRSPLWRGGGIVHGPHPRDYDYPFPRKMRWKALRSVLSEKVREETLIVVENLSLDSHKTRDLLPVLRQMGLEERKALLVDSDTNEKLWLACRNLQKIKSIRAMALNAYDVLDHDVVVLSVPAVERLQGWLET